MRVRRAVPDDAPSIAALDEECFPDAYSVKDIFSYVCQPTGMCFVAVSDGGELLAYALGRLIAPEGEIYRIATSPAHRRRGIAYRLLDYMRKCELGRGLETLFLEVRSQNIPARNLYKSFGFIEVGVRRGYYKNPTDDAVVMLKAHGADMIN